MTHFLLPLKGPYRRDRWYGPFLLRIGDSSTDHTMSENIAIDDGSIDYGITTDSPAALVSTNGKHFSVIGRDNGETVYARGIPDEDVAYMVAEKVNELRKEVKQQDNNAPKAEQLADDDDVLFAITLEDQDDWMLPAALVWTLTMLVYCAYLLARGTVRTAARASPWGDDQ